MKPQYIKRIRVREEPRPYEANYQIVSRFIGPFATKEEAKEYTVPGMLGEPEVFCMWPPDQASGGEK